MNSFKKALQTIGILQLLCLVTVTEALAESNGSNIEIDISEHYLTLTTTFQGHNLIIFGAVNSQGSDSSQGLEDLIIIIEGASRNITLFEKVKHFNIWFNEKVYEFPGVPGYRFLVSTRPLADLLPASSLSENRIELNSYLSDSITSANKKDFEDVINEMRRKNFIVDSSSVLRRKGNLFRVDVQIPANAAEGLYEVRILATRAGEIITEKSTSFWINKEGFTAWITSISDDYPLLLGVFWALVSILIGLIFSGAIRIRRHS